MRQCRAVQDAENTVLRRRTPRRTLGTMYVHISTSQNVKEWHAITCATIGCSMYEGTGGAIVWRERPKIRRGIRVDGRGREGEWGAAEGATFLTDSDELRQNQGTVKTNKAAPSVCVCMSGAEWMSAAMHPGGVPLRASRIRAGTFEGVRIGSTQYGGLGRIGDTSTFGIC